MKKIFALFFVCFFIISNGLLVFALSDYRILTDPVENTYEGNTDTSILRYNLNFTDVPRDHWARESIVRVGALDMVKGFERTFRPSANVTVEEAIAFAIRAIGKEEEARALGEENSTTLSPSVTRTLWSLGYLALARDLEIITEDEYNDVINLAKSIAENTTAPEPVTTFLRTAPATREQVAQWVIKALNAAGSDSTTNTTGAATTNNNSEESAAFPIPSSYQQIYRYSDWSNTSIDKVPYVEAALKAGVMSGFSNGTFRPKGSITRDQMAQILRNLDNTYNDTMNLIKRNGTIGGFIDRQLTATGSAQLVRSIYVRRDDGKIDVIQYELKSNSSPEPKQKDVIVYNENEIVGLASLFEGDQIEYIADSEKNTVLYILKTNPLDLKEQTGYLNSVDIEKGQITVRSTVTYGGKEYSYPMIMNMYGTNDDNDYVVIDEKQTPISNLPYGSRVSLVLRNNIVEKMKFVGQPQLMQEMRGIVVENNSDLGYITIIDNSGNRQTKNYYQNEITVKKQQYYDVDDEIGYISQVFPNFLYNPMDTFIETLEAGDIVFLRIDPEDTDTIIAASASTNYIMKYGLVRQITHNGANGSSILLETEDKQTSWLDVLPDIFVSAAGKPAKIESVQPGDWIKALVNQAIIEPGHILESLKEITVDSGARLITNIVRGQLSSLNPIQNKIVLQNYQVLEKTGWGAYQEAQQLDISSRDIEYYYNDKRISLDYASSYLKRFNGEAYVAMEKNFDRERVKKITFRDGRDEILPSDTVVQSDGTGQLRLSENLDNILTDPGTIVSRHGRLTDAQNIMASDYATVVLNGGNTAAVVEIKDAPDVTGVTIIRGRIQSIDEGKSFQVQSMAMFVGNSWIYSPVQRVFTIDYNTKFYDSTGYVDPSSFVGYSEESKLNKVYTIIADGTHADMVIDTTPYTASTNITVALRGTIYQTTDGGFSIKNIYYYNSQRGQWVNAGVSTTVNVNIPENGVVIKNNAVVNKNQLQNGDQIRVVTTTLPDRIPDQLTVDGYMTFIEK